VEVSFADETLTLAADLAPLSRTIRWVRWFPPALSVFVTLTAVGLTPTVLAIGAVQATLFFLVSLLLTHNLRRETEQRFTNLFADMQGNVREVGSH
jgi:hypothetical protein